jgi:putative ABC transport system permease protein
VAQRAREVGVRIALGAPRRQVVMRFLRQGARLLAIGLGVAFAGGRLLVALLHGVSPPDPLTWLLVQALLALVALLAAYLPARRASPTDPMSVLRAE